MKLKNTYYLLRHGETNCHVKMPGFLYPKWLATGPDIRLTDKGKDQIRKSAKELKNKKIDFIYSSDFFRTRQSSKIISDFLNIKINLDKKLRDINLGTYYGRKKEEFYKDFPLDNVKERFAKKPTKGESWNELRKRVKSFLEEIEKRHQDKNILIVSHGDTLWMLGGIIRKMTNKEMIEEILGKGYIKMGELRKIN